MGRVLQHLRPQIPQPLPTRTSRLQPDNKDFDQEKKMFENFKWGMAYVCPRGIGPSAWDGKVKPCVRSKSRCRPRKRPCPAAPPFLSPRPDLRRPAGLGRALCRPRLAHGSRIGIHLALAPGLPHPGRQCPLRLPFRRRHRPARSPRTASLPQPGPGLFECPQIPRCPPGRGHGQRTHPRRALFDQDRAAWSFYPQQLSEKFNWGKDKKAGPAAFVMCQSRSSSRLGMIPDAPLRPIRPSLHRGVASCYWPPWWILSRRCFSPRASEPPEFNDDAPRGIDCRSVALPDARGKGGGGQLQFPGPSHSGSALPQMPRPGRKTAQGQAPAR